MRIVATSDTHFPVKPGMIPFGDVFLHCGDLMQNGYPSEWPDCLDWLNELPHKTKIITFGNHDFHPFLYPGPSLQDLRKIGVTVLGFPGNANYYKAKLPNGMIVGGCPYVTGLPRWAFNASEQEVECFLDYLGHVDIFVAHSPVHMIMDEVMFTKEHVGIKAYEYYLYTTRVKYMIHGHVHEQYGSQRHESGCMIYNVAMCDRKYTHQNPPVVIDV